MEKFKKPVSIEVNGREELKKVLEKLEKMGYTWQGGDKPTDIKWLNPNREVTAIDIKFNGNLSYSSSGYILPNTKRISAKEFLGTHKNECIVIYRKGTDTIALDKSTGKKAVAKLHPDDEYDFNVGAQLAFDRLTGREKKADTPEHVNCRCGEVREVYRAAKVGEYVKIVNPILNMEYEKGDIGKVVDVIGKSDLNYHVDFLDGNNNKYVYSEECVVLENYKPTEQPKEEFKPHLLGLYNLLKIGYLGEKTLIKDVIGRDLRVGDTVELYDKNNKYYGEHTICKHKNDYPFVMSIRHSCEIDGTINNWKIIKKRNYEEIKHDEKMDGVIYVKEVQHA